ncbi:MAG: HEAT repeat domain-containing protein [Phycisphaerae bacterium]
MARRLCLPALLCALLVTRPTVSAALATQSTPASSPAASDAVTLAELVLKIAGQSDPKVRRGAAIQILRLNSSESVQALLPILASSNNEAAKLAVCEAIAEVRSKDPLFRQPLLSLLDQKEPTLREAAVAALAGYRGDATVDHRLSEIDRQLVIDEWVTLAREFYTLLPTDADRTERLKLWLASRRSFVRETALEAIYQALKKRQVEPAPVILAQLRTMIDDPEESVRGRVIEILRDLRQPEDSHLLEERLAKEELPATKELIYHALGYLQNPASIPVCLKGLQDPADSVAAKAAGALASLIEFAKSSTGTVDLQPVTRALLQRAEAGLGDDKLRAAVIDAMASIAAPEFLDVLTKYAGSDEYVPAIRQSAIRGIGAAGKAAEDRLPLVIDRLAVEQDPGVREAAVTALGHLGSRPEHLIPLRTRLDPKVELSVAVQKKAWEGYQAVFMRMIPKDRMQVISAYPDEAIRLVAEVQLAPESRQVVAEQVLDYARDKAKTDPMGVLAFLDRFSQAVPPDRLGTAWAASLADLRKQIQSTTQPAPGAAAG